jgi:glutamyl-tRNA reductase
MIVVVGASHKTAPIGVRERIAIPGDRLAPFLSALHGLPEISEVCVVSTCNRVEIYAATALRGDDATLHAANAIEHALVEQAGPQVGDVLHQYLFRYTGDAAVRHLFRVSSSLDSLVVGEAQVLGQVKDAFDLATATGTLGPLLGRAIEWAFHVAKRVRTETQVGAGSVSVSSVAVELARQIFGGLDRRVVTLVGAGTMGEAAARHLCDAGTRLIVVNRNLERAETLAQRFGGTARGWDQLQATLGDTDVAIASTGSQDYLLTPELLAPLQRKRRGRSLFVIDIAVPRNVDPRINQIDGVYLYDIDDLSKIASETIRGRFKEAQVSERIVAEEADAFDTWLDSLQVTPTIVALRNQVRAVLEAELDRSLHGKLKHLGDADRKALEGMLSAAVKKLTHHPTVRLKSAAAEGNARQLVDALQDLFAIDPEGKPTSTRPSNPPSIPPSIPPASPKSPSKSEAPIVRSLEPREAQPEEAT